jgi:probable rRNA maturation factor
LLDLNRQFRGIESPTDVLSFESGEKDPDSGQVYLGDIVISYDRAVQQASSAGHPTQNEVILLAIHGALHLIGYDHSTEEEKQQMWAIQQKMLTHNGITINKLPEE